MRAAIKEGREGISMETWTMIYKNSKFVFEISNIWFCRVETEGESFSAQGEKSQLTSAMLHALVFIFSHPLERPCPSEVWFKYDSSSIINQVGRRATVVGRAPPTRC